MNDIYESHIGKILICASACGLAGLYFFEEFENMRCLDFEKNCEILESSQINQILSDTKKWLDLYFAHKKPDFLPKLDLQGSAFELRVWDILLRIGYGKLMTYGQIAKMIAKDLGLQKMSAQAVGGAVGRNKISIIVPCHRVIGANGNLTGYASGIDKKVSLLKIEGVNVENLKMPKIDSKKITLLDK